MLNTANKLRLQFEGALGIGLDSGKVGVTTDGDDVKISGGGGAGFGVSLGYGLSRSFDIDCTLGVQVMSVTVRAEDAGERVFDANKGTWSSESTNPSK